MNTLRITLNFHMHRFSVCFSEDFCFQTAVTKLSLWLRPVLSLPFFGVPPTRFSNILFILWSQGMVFSFLHQTSLIYAFCNQSWFASVWASYFVSFYLIRFKDTLQVFFWIKKYTTFQTSNILLLVDPRGHQSLTDVPTTFFKFHKSLVKFEIQDSKPLFIPKGQLILPQ